ncbi:2'-5' RNA ligase family protein [Streptomyces tsukubensis]|uniref:2'-5' RNA ligase family protein n=1 Tax=Streptomyces tsukubensis TaxID=83656 RepID=UPI001D03C50E|nr:2'-5' RNA ligase family protein [Streptomyces tsukubensis]
MYKAGDTALVVPVPEAEPGVGGWRARFDPLAADGVPAHVTVVYPFLRAERLDAPALDALRELFGGHDAFTTRFQRCGRFPGALHLVPGETGRFRALTRDVVSRWPKAPPYGGRFGDPAPHLTITQGQEPDTLDTVEDDVRKRLPFATSVDGVDLVHYDGDRWHAWTRFALRTADTVGVRAAAPQE